jgi:hypothetical protein
MRGDNLMDDTCELLRTCSFFVVEVKNAALAEEFKKKFCYENKESCARYMIAKAAGLDKIPAALYPNEFDKALDIIHH